MTPEELIKAAGLRPAHVKITGFADECEGEPAILTGIYDAAVWPAFVFIRATDNEWAVATISSVPAGSLTATEMERERLLAETDPDGGVGQAAVIKMLRDREGGFETEYVAELPEEPINPPPPEPTGSLTDLTAEQLAGLQLEDGWG
jgi:hypothetical protein